MLDEYLALGGVEIGNNQRAYAYAQCMSCCAGLLKCPGCEGIHDATNAWIDAVYEWQATRRNLITVPSFEVTPITGWTPVLGATLNRNAESQAAAGFYSMAVTGPTPGMGASYAATGLTPGQTYTFSAYFRTNGNAKTVTLSATNPATSGLPVSNDVATHLWARASVTFVATATTSTLTVAGADAQAFYVDGAMLEPSATLNDYFDGSLLPAAADPAISRVAWTGTAHGSTSVMEQYVLISPSVSTGEPPYDCSALSYAPWFDDQNDASKRLAGFYLLSVQGATDSTMTAPTTEGLEDGGVIGAQRNTTRSVRVREMIVGCGMDAAEYGLAWLKAALSTSFCGRHGDGCGTSDLSFFIDCPPPLDSSDPDYGATSTRYRRFLHGVGATSGPIIAEQYETTSGAYVIIVDFILTAESPFVWGETVDISGTGQTLTAYDDIPFNLMRYPSGEVGDGVPAVVATQYAFNGSVEYGATGWNHAESGNPAGVTAGVSTDIAAVGPNSYRTRLVAAATLADVNLDVWHTVSLTGVPAGAKPSVSVWGAMLVFAGAPTLDSLRGVLQWRDAANALVGANVTLGDIPVNGGNLIAKGLAVPAGATQAQLHLVGVVDVTTGDDVRLYADAFALTVP